MVASVMACILSQPGDVILTETYKSCDSDLGTSENSCCPSTRDLSDVTATIYDRKRDKGVVSALSGFFTGLQARFVHVGMIITSQLVIYDLVKQLLGLPATGSH
jgi:solute carrier family 25 phosphate transporter 3